MLGTLGGTQSTARDVNELGQIVGDALPTANTPRHAVMWDGEKVIDLGAIGTSQTVAVGINNRGQVVGWANGPKANRTGHTERYVLRDVRMVAPVAGEWWVA